MPQSIANKKEVKNLAPVTRTQGTPKADEVLGTWRPLPGITRLVCPTISGMLDTAAAEADGTAEVCTTTTAVIQVEARKFGNVKSGLIYTSKGDAIYETQNHRAARANSWDGRAWRLLWV